MNDQFAVTTSGGTAAEILSAADKLSLDTLTRYKKYIETIPPALLQREVLTGKEFVEAFLMPDALRRRCLLL